MTQDDPPNTAEHPKSSSPVWILYLVAGALVLGCACSLGALFLLRQAGDLGWMQRVWPWATQPVAAATATPAPSSTALSPSATVTATSTPSQVPTATALPTRTTTATAAPTRTPTRTVVPTATPAAQASPTPFVCDSVYELAGITQLAPGQTFVCTLPQQELTDLANDYPDSPCSTARFTMDDGEITLECRMGLNMQATLSPAVKDCRVAIRVLSGTLGFRQIVQELINTQFNVIRYDSICVDRLDVEDGQLIVGGYGR